jgi:hypothetical protein
MLRLCDVLLACLFVVPACWTCSMEDLQRQFTELLQTTLAAKGVTLQVSVLRPLLRYSSVCWLSWGSRQDGSASSCTQRCMGAALAAAPRVVLPRQRCGVNANRSPFLPVLVCLCYMASTAVRVQQACDVSREHCHKWNLLQPALLSERPPAGLLLAGGTDSPQGPLGGSYQGSERV